MLGEWHEQRDRADHDQGTVRGQFGLNKEFRRIGGREAWKGRLGLGYEKL